MARWTTRFLVAGVALLLYLWVDGHNLSSTAMTVILGIAIWCIVLGVIGKSLSGIVWVARRIRES